MGLFCWALRYLYNMSTKLIITEQQYYKLQASLREGSMHENLVELLVNDLNSNYEPMIGMVYENGEYHNIPMVKNKIDETETTVKNLYEYFMKKYGLGEAFTEQVIQDWMYGRIKDNKLSRNVPIN